MPQVGGGGEGVSQGTSMQCLGVLSPFSLPHFPIFLVPYPPLGPTAPPPPAPPPYYALPPRDLNAELLKEEEGMVGQRGFITSYQDRPRLNDNQRFLMYITTKERGEYEMNLLRKVEQVGTKGGTPKAHFLRWGGPRLIFVRIFVYRVGMGGEG